MKKTKFTEQQITFALRQAETGTRVAEVCRKLGISDATFYNWKKKYGGLGVSGATAPAVFVNIVVARAYAALFNSGCSFSGFNQTFSGNSQFLISPRHRFG